MGKSLELNELLEGLGYLGSDYFLKGAELQRHPAYAHFFRKASEDLHLKGVYCLRARPECKIDQDTVVPVVYVVELDSDDPESIQKWHRKVWNQSIVPFVLLATPSSFRVYRGFRHSDDIKKDTVLDDLRDAAEILERFKDFSARSIDSGAIWERMQKHLDLDARVDNRLLKNLEDLGNKLIKEQGLNRRVAHTLIGKYVFLRYLRDRKHLSDKKFQDFGISPNDVFDSQAKISSLYELDEKLNNWLNGAIFPLPKRSGEIKEEHVKEVARAFRGENPKHKQTEMFDVFNFEYVPVETLSAVYEQFLHFDGKGKEQGAFYTPVHLVNFVLEELDTKRPLRDGMKVLDPSCGSGAFLVQCYRLLIEREVQPSPEKKILPSRLRELLERNIFGLDIDGDACSVTELSLALTLLDYVDPPDLKRYPTFKLPALRNRNIFHCEGGFFDESSAWNQSESAINGYDWIVGNPPWIKLNSSMKGKSAISALEWMREKQEDCPTGDNQIAQAFAWKTSLHLSPEGLAGLVMPAMTLFMPKAKRFRHHFFENNDVWAIANLANFTYRLFAGRGRLPTMLLFFNNSVPDASEEQFLTVFSPFIAEQEASRDYNNGAWSITVEQNAIKQIPRDKVASGDSLPWKAAMWGSWRDLNLLKRIESRFPSFLDFASQKELSIHQGIELRECGSSQAVEPMPELAGQPIIDMGKIKKNTRNLFHLPDNILFPIPPEKANIRIRGGKRALRTSIPPHIFVDASRNYSIYSDSLVHIPARQIGIAGHDEKLLKALSLYLSSDFAKYHQFLFSAQWGIQKSISNLETLLKLPIPFSIINTSHINSWAKLHNEFVKASKHIHGDLFVQNSSKKNYSEILDDLRKSLNNRVYELLGLNNSDRNLVKDLVNVRMHLVQGKVPKAATRSATKSEMVEYCQILAKELDEFLGVKKRHDVNVYAGTNKALLVVRNQREPRPNAIIDVTQDEHSFNAALEKLGNLVSKRKQWMYFDRGLRIYSGDRICLFKPKSRLHWLKSQALLDADAIISDLVSQKA